MFMLTTSCELTFIHPIETLKPSTIVDHHGRCFAKLFSKFENFKAWMRLSADHLLLPSSAEPKRKIATWIIDKDNGALYF
jgi:hypothetical protein